MCVIGELNIKRFYLPFANYSTCSKCGFKNIIDFNFESLHYPELNQDIPVTVCCGGCSNDYDFKISLQLNVTIKEY